MPIRRYVRRIRSEKYRMQMSLAIYTTLYYDMMIIWLCLYVSSDHSGALFVNITFWWDGQQKTFCPNFGHSWENIFEVLEVVGLPKGGPSNTFGQKIDIFHFLKILFFESLDGG